MPANRNVMYLIIGALIVDVGVLGYNLYQTKKEPEGLQNNDGPSDVKRQNKGAGCGRPWHSRPHSGCGPGGAGGAGGRP